MALKVLYVEDNPLNLRLVRRMLLPDGYVLIDAPNAAHGIHLACKMRPDLILMDMNLPDMHGSEAVQRIRANPEVAHIPIIALTASSMYGDRERFLALGCDGYVAKPISRKELLNVIAYFINKSAFGAKIASAHQATAAREAMERSTDEVTRYVDPDATQSSRVARQG
jgi:two-component system cell cycle response regulator DivK